MMVHLEIPNYLLVPIKNFIFMKNAKKILVTTVERMALLEQMTMVPNFFTVEVQGVH